MIRHTKSIENPRRRNSTGKAKASKGCLPNLLKMKDKKIMTRTITILPFTILALACSKNQPPAETPDEPTLVVEAPAEPTEEEPTRSASGQSQVVIAPSIREACGISDAEAFFEYDSAQVSTDGMAMLGRLAACFDTGPLKGRTMTLIGHADERGSDEYNMKLGSRRAESVKDALSSFGLDTKVITTSSRGESNATGTDSTSWFHDRRVDVALGG